MSNYKYKLPQVKDEDTLEDLCKDLYTKTLRCVEKNGRRGQRQDGVDVYGINPLSNKEYIGYQCKVKNKADIEDKNFKKKFIAEIESEANKVLGFKPTLKEYHIFTTAPRDADIQEHVRLMSSDGNFPFSISIVFWDDIEDMLINDFDLLKKYFPQFIIIRQKGQMCSKFIELEIGHRKNKPASRYEIMLGYTIKTFNLTTAVSLEYYANSFYIANMHNRAIDSFPARCFPWDLKHVFENEHDALIIADWLNSINVIEEVQNKKSHYTYTWDDERYKEYILSLRD